jgi:CheY-like chemotaxis protein
MAESLQRNTIRILIVEDNRGDVVLVREAFKETGIDFELTHMADGEQALRYLHRVAGGAEAERPDVVLLDLNLPKRDGWELLDAIRRSPALASTPVVILSSSGNPEDAERAARTPLSIYIRKPCTLDEFLDIGRQIEEFRSGAAADQL